MLRTFCGLRTLLSNLNDYVREGRAMRRNDFIGGGVRGVDGKDKKVVRYMRQLYDNWLVFQQEQLAVHGWMARSGWPGEWAEA